MLLLLCVEPVNQKKEIKRRKVNIEYKVEDNIVKKKRKKSFTKLMLDSKLFWIYFQSNSAPLAPIQSSKNLVSKTSAPAQPIPAVKTLAWPLPGIPFRTNDIPTRSARSIVDFKNSCVNKKGDVDISLTKGMRMISKKNEWTHLF